MKRNPYTDTGTMGRFPSQFFRESHHMILFMSAGTGCMHHQLKDYLLIEKIGKYSVFSWL
jgi:hypothetical protein